LQSENIFDYNTKERKKAIPPIPEGMGLLALNLE